jgi:2-hydroxymuconate-semialdehyde hydrolase
MALQEQDVAFESMNVRIWEGGRGFPILLLHGSGAGASTFINFRHVLEPLSREYHVLAADLIGFGMSGLKPREPYFDMELWLRQAAFLVDRLPGGPVGIVGHSLSGALALKLAARNPRVTKVLTTGTMGTPNVDVPGQTRGGWVCPKNSDEIRQFAEFTVHFSSVLQKEDLEYREKIVNRPGYRDYFSKMFGRERGYYLDTSALDKEELSQVKADVLMLHGINDKSFPPEETSLMLARSLPQADVLVLGQCGHSVALEYPEKFLAACRTLFGQG